MENNSMCIEDNNAKFIYKMGLFDVKFEECEIHVQEDGAVVKKGDAIVRISEDWEDVKVRIEDTRVLIGENGEDVECLSLMYFLINKDFDESSVYSRVKIDNEQKTKDAYNLALKFLSLEELKGYYNKSLSICEQLNEE
jgi:hypothetical protein